MTLRQQKTARAERNHLAVFPRLVLLLAVTSFCSDRCWAVEAPPLERTTTQSQSGQSEYRDLAYVPNGHPRQKLDLYVPSSGTSHPLIIWIHGGAWRGGSKEQSFALRAGFRERGYAIASIGYRLSGEALFPAQIEDCKAAIRWLRAHAESYHLDPNRFAVWGSSAGGHLAALVGTTGDVNDFDKGENLTTSSKVQAVCDFYGPTDFVKFVTTPGFESHANSTSPESLLLGGAVLENKEKAKAANPITFISAEDPPFLIVHGSRDRVVAPQQSVLLHQALKEAKVFSIHHVIGDAGHGGPQYFRADIINMVDHFFRQALKIGNGDKAKK